MSFSYLDGLGHFFKFLGDREKTVVGSTQLGQADVPYIALKRTGRSVNNNFRNGYAKERIETKASELVPCSLLPHWNSMRFFATVSLSDMNSLQEVKFATLYRQSSKTSQIL